MQNRQKSTSGLACSLVARSAANLAIAHMERSAMRRRYDAWRPKLVVKLGDIVAPVDDRAAEVRAIRAG